MSSLSPMVPNAVPTLQIYSPERSEPDLPTLRDIFVDILEPQMRDGKRTQDTIDDVRRAVDRWEWYWQQHPHWQPAVNKWSRTRTEDRTTNPVLTIGVTVAHLEHWRDHAFPELSARTRNKYVKAIQQILAACNRHDVPTSSARAISLPQGEAVKYYITAEQLCQLWPHADELTWPRVPGISTADWWRSLVALYWTYGFRLQDLFAVKASKKRNATELQWSAITREALTPNPDGQAMNALGWLSYTPSKTKRHRPKPLYLPITRVADAALRRFEKTGTIGSIVKAPRCSREFYTEWYRWQELAGLKDRSGEPFIPYSLRKSAATYLDAHCPGLADAVIGWSTGSQAKSKMGQEVYINTEPTLIQHLPTYAYPSCFNEFVLA